MAVKAFRAFQHRGQTYCLNGDDLTVRPIDASTAGLLAEVESDPGLAEAPRFRSVLKKLGLARAESVTPPPPPAPGPVSALTLLITQRCNLRCVYCYGQDPGPGAYMSQETAFAAVDWLIRQSGPQQRLTVAFFGGEPLLNFAVLRRTVEYAKTRCAEAGKAVSFSLTTNATLLGEHEAAWLAREMGSVAVSCDGPQKIHDARRPRRDGGGSYAAVSAGVARLLGHGQALGQRLLGRAVWSGEDDPRVVRDALAGLGFPRVSLGQASPSVDWKKSGTLPKLRDLSPLGALAEAEAAALLSRVKAREENPARLTPLATPLATILQRLLNREKRLFFCGRGRASLAVSHQGGLYPCHRFVGEKPFSLGRLDNAATGREAHCASPVVRQRPCVCCFAKYLCGGGCAHDHLAMTGQAGQPAPDFCRLMRRQAEIAAALSLELDGGDRAWLVERKIVEPANCPLDF